MTTDDADRHGRTGRYIGRSLPRREDDSLITGRGRYVDDVRLASALHVSFVRSPHACGRIVQCDVSAAVAIPGVVGVFTGADVGHLGSLTVNPVLETVNPTPYPILAGERIMAVGEPVAAIVATSPMAGADAADAVAIDVAPEDAAPHTDRSIACDPLLPGQTSNVALAQTWLSDDVKTAFEQADFIAQIKLNHPRLAPSSLEPRTVAADVEPDNGKLTVWLSTQTPHRARGELAGILGVDEARIRVVAPDVGGAFGMKASLYPEEVFVAWAALTLRRPVRWTATRGEDLLTATHGRGTASAGQLALTRDGRFLGLKADITCPLGHWLPTSAAIPAWNAARILPGPYMIDAVDISTKGVVTNSAPVGIYRGAGRPEAAALMERLVEEAARITDIDPVEIRRRNLLPGDRLPHTGPTGIVLDSGDYPAALERLRELADYDALLAARDRRRRKGELAGMGLAFYVEPSGRGWESARVRLDPDGGITAATGGSSQGHGRETAFAQIVAEVFDVPPETVRIEHGDTDTAPAGIGALASRSTAIGGSALRQAAERVRERADRLGGINETVEADVIYENDGEAWGYGCYLACVTIDRETGVTTVDKLFCVDDAGQLVNPMLVEGQIMGGVAQGLGEALMERIVYDDDGQLLTGSLTDYALPRAADMPPIVMSSLSTPSPFNLLGAKGVGEAGTIGAPTAVLNAALDALHPLGVRRLDMPLTSESVWRAIAAATTR